MNPIFLADDDDDDDFYYDPSLDPMAQAEELMAEMFDNNEVIDEVAKAGAQQKEFTDKIYANKMLSKGDFVSISGNISGHTFDKMIRKLFVEEWQKFFDDKDHFYMSGDRDSGFSSCGDLCSSDVHKVYIRMNRSLNAQEVAQLKEDSTNKGTRVFAENSEDIDSYGSAIATMEITDDFYRYLASLSPREFSKLAGGALQQAFINELSQGT